MSSFMDNRSKNIVLISPFLIIGINFAIAIIFGNIIGKWAFVPIILIEWVLFVFFVLKYGGKESIIKWLGKSKGSFWWAVLAIFIGLLPLPLFLMHSDLLAPWEIWVPWIILALINPWIEEFYWRGLLLKYTDQWSNWKAILFTSFVFAANHAVFGVNSELNSGVTVIISTFIMGVVWGVVFKKTQSLRWVIFAHFLVDFFNLSVPSFLDLYQSGW
ncbi:CPBP family intramembrane glutamic endopeptidase [Aquimarina sp. 2201CG5-10]|uniref:CPBP family intramembrane glutamic endopeptidase n=1 Tax=Aquimarina callyspongiae TaxID=3098150 RepID=UPI002AB5171D|nr:CPBP family intramembrane glutamic endopeptidase [Aquimarina sp. 2201CG5-10]MDY8135696.1 CPBP family intramembrane glutamic endopeptidase [Aquimarina sp. 2201CG5-10]